MGQASLSSGGCRSEFIGGESRCLADGRIGAEPQGVIFRIRFLDSAVIYNRQAAQYEGRVPLAAPRQPLTVPGATRLLASPTRSPLQELEEIYDEHVWRVYAFFAYRLGNRDAAEDLTQATFERAVRAFKRYDARRGSHQTWLMAIANNLLIDHFRRNASSPTRPLEQEDLDYLPAGSAPELSLGLDPELAAALTTLSEREREIVALRYGGDLTGPQIAELKDLSLANVQQILSRALRQMRVALDESHAELSERRPAPAGPRPDEAPGARRR